MPLYIIDQAICQCSQSSTPSTLQVKSQKLLKIQNQLVATESDKPEIPFGCCNNDPRKPCKPKLKKWEDTTEDTTINAQKSLTEDSYIMCEMGGKITICNHTQVNIPVE